jgi:ribokinase
MKPIVVVGSINMDIVSTTERMPNAGETVVGSDFQMHSGGKGANQAVAVAKLGYPSVLLGVLGDDLFGTQLLSTLNGYGVDTDHLGKVAGSSGTASIVVDAKGENAIIVTPGANRYLSPQYLESKMDVLRGSAMVLAQLEVPIDTVEWLADLCKAAGIPFMLDPAPATQLTPKLLSAVTWFTPNQTEAAFYAADARSHEETIKELMLRGVANVILKRGSDGALVSMNDGQQYAIDAVPVRAVDTTAAGDAFNGAFSVALVSGNGVRESARFAAAAAAISVTRAGAQPSLPGFAEVDAFCHIENLQAVLASNW